MTANDLYNIAVLLVWVALCHVIYFGIERWVMSGIGGDDGNHDKTS